MLGDLKIGLRVSIRYALSEFRVGPLPFRQKTIEQGVTSLREFTQSGIASGARNPPHEPFAFKKIEVSGQAGAVQIHALGQSRDRLTRKKTDGRQERELLHRDAQRLQLSVVSPQQGSGGRDGVQHEAFCKIVR